MTQQHIYKGEHTLHTHTRTHAPTNIGQFEELSFLNNNNFIRPSIYLFIRLID